MTLASFGEPCIVCMSTNALKNKMTMQSLDEVVPCVSLVMVKCSTYLKLNQSGWRIGIMLARLGFH